MSTIELELLKSGLTLLASVTTLGLGWVVGQRLTVQWNLRQKQREHDLATAQEFHKIYGEFFAVWKLWNFHLRESPTDPSTRNQLFTRACSAEGNVESLLVRLSSGRPLNLNQSAVLGKFRQGYQTLRQAIRDGRPLNWGSSEHKQYVAFKKLATEVALLIVAGTHVDGGTLEERSAALLRITSNQWENEWWQ